MGGQPKDTGNSREGNAKRPYASTETKHLTESDLKDLRRDVKDLTVAVKNISQLIKTLLDDKSKKIPGIK